MQSPSVDNGNEKPPPREAVPSPNSPVCNSPADDNYPYITYSILKKDLGRSAVGAGVGGTPSDYPQQRGGATNATQLRAKHKHAAAPGVSGSELVTSCLGRGQVGDTARTGRLWSETDACLWFDPENTLHLTVLIRGNYSFPLPAW